MNIKRTVFFNLPAFLCILSMASMVSVPCHARRPNNKPAKNMVLAQNTVDADLNKLDNLNQMIDAPTAIQNPLVDKNMPVTTPEPSMVAPAILPAPEQPGMPERQNAQPKPAIAPEKKEPASLKKSIQQDLQKLSNGAAAAQLPQPESLDDNRIQLPLEFQKKEPVLKELAPLADEDEEKIEYNFENADLSNLIDQVEELFDVKFIPDDAINPLKQGSKAIKGNKISFKTNKPLSRKEAWDLFITFLNLAGLTITPYGDYPRMYRVVPVTSAYRSAIPTFIGVDFNTLPNNDEMIRYVYFFENIDDVSETSSIFQIVEALKSSSSKPLYLKENRAIILTDKAYNIRELMKIIKELDRASMPQALSVIKLKHADATDVTKLYTQLIRQTADANMPGRPFNAARKQPTSLYFPENTKIIAEPRTNSLILLGEKDAIQKIEDFVIRHIDVDLDQPYSPLHTYKVQNGDAEVIARIMNNVTKVGQSTAIGQAGGIRGEDKYFKAMNFVAEKSTNRIIVKGSYEDFLKAKEIMEKLDKQQPQVALDILILSINEAEAKKLGTQLRSKEAECKDGIFGSNVKFQTAQLGGVQTNTDPSLPGVDRLLGNLINLAIGQSAGNTIITLGQDIFGVWGIFQALQTVTNSQVVSNPFLVATNKTQAIVSVGQTRRVTTSDIITNSSADPLVPALGNEEANLKIIVTPQINADGMVILDLRVEITDFTSPDVNSPTKDVRIVQTSAIVADKEVLALGGIVRNRVNSEVNKVPFWGDIPGLGWLFKNKANDTTKDYLLILSYIRIINPESPEDIQDVTRERIRDYHGTIDQMHGISERRDPINRLFFRDGLDQRDQRLEHIISSKNTNIAGNRRVMSSSNDHIAQAPSEAPAQSKPLVAVQSPEISIAKPVSAGTNQQLSLAEKIRGKKRTVGALSGLGGMQS